MPFPMQHRSLSAIVLTFLAACSAAYSQASPSVYPELTDTTEPPSGLPLMNLEYQEAGVVVLALGTVADQPDKDTKDLLDLQFQIARATASFGPVLLLVTDADSRATVWDDCGRYAICKLLSEQRVRVAIVPHEGPWVRDYGPSFGIAEDGSPVVIHAKYHAHDTHLDARHERAHLNKVREAILRGEFEHFDDSVAEPQLRRLFLRMLDSRRDAKSLMTSARDDGDGAPSDATEQTAGESGELAMKTAAQPDDASETVDFGDLAEKLRLAKEKAKTRMLTLLRDLVSVYADEASFERGLDDEAHYALAETVLRHRTFALYRPPIAMDGGNILQFQDGECITTTDLIKENGGIERLLRSTLVKYYGCRKVIYLTPLPGPVIKHVDMFILPVGGKKVLMASYDPDSDLAAGHWGELESWQKALMFEAALAMKKNQLELERNGYKVIPVPSLPPAKGIILGEESIYYPTVLNALVRTDSAGRHQVLMPFYGNLQEDVQQRDADLVRREFGAGTEVVQLEATAVAKGQGAIHCLTLMVPEKLSIFADQGELAIREALLKRMKNLEAEVIQRNHFALEGLWHGVAASGDGEEESLEQTPEVHVEFKDSTLQIWSAEDKKLLLSYKVDPRSSTKWLLSGSYATEKGSPGSFEGKIIWKDSSHLELRLASFPRLDLAKQEAPHVAAPNARSTSN